MTEWLLIAVLVAPNYAPTLITEPLATEQICNERVQALHAAAPMAPAIFKCIHLTALLGEPT